jgi:flagellar protein FlaG
MSIELNTQSPPAAIPSRATEPLVAKLQPGPAQADKSPSVQPEAPKPPPVDMAKMQKDLEEAIGRLNDHMKKNNTQLSFSMDNTLNQVVVVVKNQQTGNVVRQIPNEAALRMAHHIEETRGLFEDHNI